MQTPMGNTMFRLMSLEFRLKAMVSDPAGLLAAAGVRTGMTLLDFGCGPGRYTIPAARIVGPAGRVYAVDLHPLARAGVGRRARRRGLSNIETLATDSALPLPDASVDFVLLYDTLHDVDRREAVVGELLRVLRAGGVFSYRDHTLDAEAALGAAVRAGRLQAIEGGDQTMQFLRTPASGDRPTRSAGEP